MDLFRRGVYKKLSGRPDFLRFNPEDIVVGALGGNAIENRDGHEPIVFCQDKVDKAIHALLHVCGDAKPVIVYGNGPQYSAVEKEWREAEREFTSAEVVEETQKRVGEMIRKAVESYYAKAEVDAEPKEVLIHNTRVLVNPEDPAFENPQKPVGPWTTDYCGPGKKNDSLGEGLPGLKPGETAKVKWKKPDGVTVDMLHYYDGEVFHYREVVPSPAPQSIKGIDEIKNALSERKIVVAGGGGGVPATPEGDLSQKAVIDKDRTAAKLAQELGAKALIILTAADGYQIANGTPDAETITEMPSWYARLMSNDPQMAGSMGPKLEALATASNAGVETTVVTSIDAFKKNDRARMTRVRKSPVLESLVEKVRGLRDAVSCAWQLLRWAPNVVLPNPRG